MKLVHIRHFAQLKLEVALDDPILVSIARRGFVFSVQDVPTVDFLGRLVDGHRRVFGVDWIPVRELERPEAKGRSVS